MRSRKTPFLPRGTIPAAGIDRAGGVVTNHNDCGNDATTKPILLVAAQTSYLNTHTPKWIWKTHSP